MSRCGCSSQCSCAVVGGEGVDVSGTGAPGNPYVVSVESGGVMQVTDTPTVDLTLLGSGTAADPYILSATAQVSPVAGNLLSEQPDGLAVTCEDVQDCVGQALADGLEYDDDANQIRARISTQGGNSLSIGPDGGLFAPTGGGATVVTSDTDCITMAGDGAGTPLSASPRLDASASNLLTCGSGGLAAELAVAACGLTGDGSAAAPLGARTQPWPYACPVDDEAGGVYCDASGTLRGEPLPRMALFYNTENRTGLDEPVPDAITLVGEANVEVSNPDPCRPSQVMVFWEADVDFTLPPNARAVFRLGGEEYARFFNYSTTVTRSIVHTHVHRTVFRDALNPGESELLLTPIEVSGGQNGARYTRVQFRAIALLLSLPGPPPVTP